MKHILKILIPALILLQTSAVRADEGMWIPLLLQSLNEKEMQQMGMRISADDIYSINHSSLKDAILLFGGGCTAEIISDQGLILTNHHCGYGQIHHHSSVEHDYLTDGFWAMNRQEELPNPGLTVTRLVRMEDVTQQMLQDLPADLTEKQRNDEIAIRAKTITDEAEKDTYYKAAVEPFYYGNEYYLLVYEIFKDVRLVGAPPSNIGKFGGDTDNWMWPRHTGDFSLFRIYVNENNEPAEYAKTNVPYQPLYSIPISIKGVKEDDFTFIFGFPGTTQEYLPSDAIETLTQVENPARISLRRQKLDIYEAFMVQDPAIRIQYSLKHARLSNGWKKWIGESRGIQKLDGIEQKQNFEEGFTRWINGSPELSQKYGGLLPAFEAAYDVLDDARKQMIYLIEAGLGIEIVRAAGMAHELVQISANKETTEEDLQKALTRLQENGTGFYSNYYQPIDRRAMVTMLQSYREAFPAGQLPPVFATIRDKYDGNIQKFADAVFEKSIFASQKSFDDFFDKYKQKRYRKIESDLAVQMATGLMDYYRSNILPVVNRQEIAVDSMMRIYMRAQREYQPDKRFYPDANSTLRVAYGKVKPYYTRDGVFYEYQTTLQGIMEKEDPAIYDYVVEDKLKQL
ncbi:MAG: S46 family peptidase, partial [Bacteroidales bacterium]|nr:S46 family peptidase [Bacteroidales bacterium]